MSVDEELHNESDWPGAQCLLKVGLGLDGRVYVWSNVERSPQELGRILQLMADAFSSGQPVRVQ